MKNILVPTDFSACATDAIELAFSFAKFFDAKLSLFTCLDIPQNWDSLSPEEQAKSPEDQQKVKNASILMNDWLQKAEREAVQLNVIISGGVFLEELITQVEQTKAEFVVMGSHGASGKQEYFLGSNTQKAIRKLHIPLFVVKNPVKEFSFKEVIYASDFNANDKGAFLRFLDFIKWFTPKTIHLLSINTSGWFSQPSILMKEAMKDFKALCGEEVDCKMHFYKDFSVDAGIRHFAEEMGADLVAVSNHNRHPLKRIFQGSNVEALVNHCETPVLSIDYRE